MKSIFVVLFSSLVLISCSNSSSGGAVKKTDDPGPPPVINAKPGQGRIAVAGDSLAHGFGATDFTVTPGGCIANHFPGSVDTSSAVDGATSADLSKRIPSVLKRSPKLVFVSSGGNDAIMDYYYKVSIGELPPPESSSSSGSTDSSANSGSNSPSNSPSTSSSSTSTSTKTLVAYPSDTTLLEMNQIFTDLQNTGALVVYLGLKPPLPGSERLSLISDLAISKGVIVVDGMDGLWLDPNLMADQFHPNDAGYKIMCDRIVSAVTPYYP